MLLVEQNATLALGIAEHGYVMENGRLVLEGSAEALRRTRTVTAKPESPSETVELGDLGYWPPGSAFCIFFGPTPASRGQEIRPASPVNVFGRISGDATVFTTVRSGTAVRVERA